MTVQMTPVDLDALQADIRASKENPCPPTGAVAVLLVVEAVGELLAASENPSQDPMYLQSMRDHLAQVFIAISQLCSCEDLILSDVFSLALSVAVAGGTPPKLVFLSGRLAGAFLRAHAFRTEARDREIALILAVMLWSLELLAARIGDSENTLPPILPRLALDLWSHTIEGAHKETAA